ncbi:MAG: hypothetical protein H6718_08150 [Polyangiaceae bacterium]|nr:hypothetical protein [Myxococcales bacterium]MCB9585355.1 hypothetical protein [Polyangiaceae bacterium]MCB9606629.1 hypothetical protein [Polyangiaceae bacterium]
MQQKPLIALVMIVKNEAAGMRRTLESVRNCVDSWSILDTGSTDGTQDIIREVLGDLPGDLHSGPFVNFEETRNRALELSGERAVFNLLLNGDDALREGAALRRFCESRRASQRVEDEAFQVRVRYSAELIHDSPRVVRSAAGWRYLGVTHEILCHPDRNPPTERVPDAYIEHDLRPEDDRTKRWEEDLELLRADLQRRPGDARSTFYLAQTYECLGRLEEAEQTYRQRIALGDWEEEVYESMFRLGRVAEARSRPWSECQQLYLDAHAHSPFRAEPLFAVAWYWYQAQNWPLCYLFAQRGAQIPFPEQSKLFVDVTVYESKLLDLVGTAAFYVKEFAVGRSALERLLERTPDDARLRENLKLYP